MNHSTVMKCEQIEAEDIVERYLSGELREEERQAFEDHYFGCAECFEHLRIARALKERPRERGDLFGTASHSSGVSSAWLYIAAGVIVVIFASVFLRPRIFIAHQEVTGGTPESSRKAAERQPSTLPAGLAHVDPLPYSPILARGNEEQATIEFRRAMEHYEKKDFSASIRWLESAEKLAPRSAPVHLYLGVCYLLTGQSDAAIPVLEIADSADSADYAEQARFYLAKAYLIKGDTQKAKIEIQRVIDFHGDRENEARDLKQALDTHSGAESTP
jgi:tetratricopeptide (TPR) repeat protein